MSDYDEWAGTPLEGLPTAEESHAATLAQCRREPEYTRVTWYSDAEGWQEFSGKQFLEMMESPGELKGYVARVKLPDPTHNLPIDHPRTAG